ncbi:MAG: hypothetical protein ABFD89_06620 [Bryobacteraceae bacterium]
MPGAYAPVNEVQIGAVAYLFGIANSGTPISITGIPSFETESDDVQLTWTEKENADTKGSVQNITQFNFKLERSIKFKPSGATRAAAHAVADAVLTLQFLVVANYKVAAFNGTWRIKPGTKVNLKQGDDAAIDISAEKYTNADQQAALTGAPIQG